MLDGRCRWPRPTLILGVYAIVADQQLGGAAAGIGFAIPSNVAKDIASQLIDHANVIDSHRAALGVTVTTVADQDGEPVGVGIASLVSGGAASRAGLQAGDVITSVNSRHTLSAQDLGAVSGHP